MTEEQRKERADTIAGIRAMADFLENNPTVPMPLFSGQNAFVANREELSVVLRRQLAEAIPR